MKIDHLLSSNINTTSNKSLSNKGPEPKTRSFSDVLIESIEKVNALQKEADNAIEELLLGQNKDIVQTMITMEKADISFKLMMQVRNKIIQAYEEIMRMQL